MPPPAVSVSAPLAPSAGRHWLGAAVLVALVVVAYAGVRNAGFIWDDDSHVTANPCIIGPLGLKEIWTTASANYFPLVLTNFWVQHAWWGLNPLAYHVVTVALHVLNALLLWQILRRLGIPGAWLGAALWALHPVQVESVAWISETKNTQSALFYLSAVWLYLRWLARPSRSHVRDYVAMVICAALALLSKPSTVMLPAVLLLCSWWQQKSWAWKNAISLIPLFALSVLVSAWTIWEQKYHSFALGPEWDLSLLQRFALSGKCFWFYLGKLLWPSPVMFIYPRWSTAVSWSDFVPLGLVVLTLVVLWCSRKRLPAGLFVTLYFVALLFPVMGFFNVYFFRYSFVSDHFQYLASMAPLASLAAGLAHLTERLRPRLYTLATCPALILLGAATWSTAREVETFKDSKTLWTTTLARNPECWMAHTILGMRASDEGRLDEAIRFHRRALQINPDSHEAHYNLGRTLVHAGRLEEGMAEYRRALTIKPNFSEAENNLGAALAASGKPAEALPHYEKAIRLSPRQPETHFLQGLALTLCGRGNEAVPSFLRALELRPAYPEAHYALARTFESMGRTSDAITEYRETTRLRPEFVDAHTHVAALLFKTGDTAGAADAFGAALKINPQDVDTRADLALVLAQSGRTPEAIAQFEKVVALDPKRSTARYNLGILLRGAGREPEGLAQIAEARRLNPALPAPPR